METPRIEREDDFLVVNGNKIYINKELQEFVLEEHAQDPSQSSLFQFQEIAKLPGFVKSIGLPDFHAGYALPIGSVAVIDLEDENASISPNGVGFDINCGVRCLKTNLFLEDISDELKEKIGDKLAEELPFENLPESKRVTISEINKILDRGMEYLKEKGIVTELDLLRTESRGSLNGDSRLVGQKSKARGMAQLSTLGSGNHYLEVEVVNEIFHEEAASILGIKKNQILLSIHTGSRGLGHGCCSDIMREIEEFNKPAAVKEEMKNKLKSEFKKISQDETLTKEEKQVLYNQVKQQAALEQKAAKDSSGKSAINALQAVPFNSPIGKKYYNTMNTAANFAWVNRSMISEKVKQVFTSFLPESKIELITDVCHNIGKIENIDGKEILVLRKGASRILPPNHPELPDEYKKIGQPVLVGGSMGTSSYLIVGSEGAKDTFYSTCHGAGRLISRSKAKNVFTYEQVAEDLKSKGISFRAGSSEGMVEESPGCYKDVDVVINHAEKVGISKKVCSVRPILVVKG